MAVKCVTAVGRPGRKVEFLGQGGGWRRGRGLSLKSVARLC